MIHHKIRVGNKTRLIIKMFSISAEEVSGPVLKLWKVSRMDMGAYMCIARNGVPPAVSKRIELGIDCESFDLKMSLKYLCILQFPR